MIQGLENTSHEKIKMKVKESLGQTLRDLEDFMKIFPDLSAEDINNINFLTLSILPATLSESLEICSSCRNYIIFREDLNPDSKKLDSLAETLNSDLTQTSKPKVKDTLKKKLKFRTETNEHEQASLNILKLISSRMVGMGSLYFPKTYGPSGSYHGVTKKMLEDLNKTIPKNLEKALFLSPEQVQAMKTFNFVATGFYGVGKTTVLEVAIDNIIEKSKEFPNPKIIFVTWYPSKGLKQMFEAKFEQIRQKNHPHLENDSLQVLSLSEICNEYNVKPVQSGFKTWLSSWLWVNRQKVDLLNDLCKKLKGKFSLQMHMSIIDTKFIPT